MQMPVASQLNGGIISLEVQKAQLLVENTELHPLVMDVSHRINELKKRRNEEIRKVITQALTREGGAEFYQDLALALENPAHHSEHPSVMAGQQAYQAWVNRLNNPASSPSMTTMLTSRMPGASAELDAPQAAIATATSLSLAPREQQELARLTRDYGVHAGTYRTMQARLEKAKITERLGNSDEGLKFKILEPARLPLTPVRPNPLKIFFFSLFLGVFIGAGIAFLAEYLDQSFQNAEDLQVALELPVLGSISTIVTEHDLEIRQKRRRGWVTLRNQVDILKRYVLQPVWSRIDRSLQRRGL